MKIGMIKKIFTISVISIMSLSLVACGGSEAKTEGIEQTSTKVEVNKDVQRIKDKGKLVVGLSADYAPYEFHKIIDGKDEIVGFDVEIAKEIAKDLGVQLEIKDMDFNTLVGSLPAGKIDLIISGMSPTPERAEAVDFSDIYYTATHGILVKAENKDKYKTLDDFAGKKIGAQMGSIQADLAKNEIKNVDLKLLSDVNNLIMELKSGKIDGLAVELPVAEMAMKGNTDLILSTPQLEDNEGGSAVAIKKGSKGLVKQVNETIKRLQDSGKIDEFVVKAQQLAHEQ
ncbi:ABC transporter substrate-binding protein [Clostridium tarantellae]|uniref:Transporter substrate-binding domain-containing protein n=1 Tax=Clostridium tarantellae TaxID=39493 RepID=A0A6I1MGE0_9CLOT|nr:ABC transporter substrate-binding protein [Clostridium tarantellae]MPQ42596.1 transporter substrate-binding domain-containing protein [Clostridium tarantellae]